MVGELRKVEDENCLHRDGFQHGQEHHPGRVRGRVRLCLLKRKPGQRCKDSRTSSLGRTDAAKMFLTPSLNSCSEYVSKFHLITLCQAGSPARIIIAIAMHCDTLALSLSKEKY